MLEESAPHVMPLAFGQHVGVADQINVADRLTTFRFLPIYGDTFHYFVLRMTSDEIGAANGWNLHVDGVHLNRRGGMILAGLVQDFPGFLNAFPIVATMELLGRCCKRLRSLLAAPQSL